MENLFVYGTLRFSQIVKRLTGKEFESESATLPGFQRLLVKNCDYPAVVEKPGFEVNGLVLKDIDECSMQQFILFEGNQYEKREVKVVAGNQIIKAVTFVWSAGEKLLEQRDWNQSLFEKKSLRKYC